MTQESFTLIMSSKNHEANGDGDNLDMLIILRINCVFHIQQEVGIQISHVYLRE